MRHGLILYCDAVEGMFGENPRMGNCETNINNKMACKHLILSISKLYFTIDCVTTVQYLLSDKFCTHKP